MVGVIAATLVQFGWSTAERLTAFVPALTVFVAALAVVWAFKGRLVVPAVVAGGGLTGWALAL